MGRSVFLASVVAVLGVMAFAGHAVSLESETAPTVNQDPLSPPTAAPAAEPAPAAQPAPQVNVTFPSELDVYMIPAATHEVCTKRDWGYGEIETDCRIQPVPLRREDPVLRGLCITRYGQRICH
jgi:hypothetical protein